MSGLDDMTTWGEVLIAAAGRSGGRATQRRRVGFAGLAALINADGALGLRARLQTFVDGDGRKRHGLVVEERVADSDATTEHVFDPVAHGEFALRRAVAFLAARRRAHDDETRQRSARRWGLQCR